MKQFLNIFRAPIILVSLFVLAACDNEQTIPIEELLPNGVVNADILDVKIPKRAETLALRMREAMEENQEWIISYMKENAQPGEHLPYHPNLGLTKAEYDEFFRLYEKREVIIKAKIPISFSREEDTVTISTNGLISFLDGMVINVREKSVTCQFGVLKNPKWKTSAGRNPPIGDWQGYRWYLESGTLESGDMKTVSFSLSRLDTGEISLEFRVNLMESGKMVIQKALNLKFNRSTSNSSLNQG